MSFYQMDTQYYAYLVAWLVIPVALFALCSRKGRLAGVLVFTYLMGFLMNHWIGALVHASPQSLFADSSDTIFGFYLSTLGLFAFASGVLLASISARLPMNAIKVAYVRELKATNSKLPPMLVGILLAIGGVSWTLSFTPLSSLPSASAVLGAGKQCAVLAVCLACWSTWNKGQTARFWSWLAAAFVLPVVTIITEGFIGYGVMMLTTILAFIAMFFRPRWVLLVGLMAGIYAGLSFWVAYFGHREVVRATVWGGADYQTRLSTLFEVFESVEPLDFTNHTHLERIDMRLNQNWLVGAAIRTTPNLVPYKNGETVYAAILAIIPRAIWPDKPATGGSGDYVSQHTLVQFAEGTSVGMGQVLEFYINFGVLGVLVGFGTLGLLLRYFDLRLTRALEARDFHRVLFFFLVGMGAIQVGGSLTEMVAAMGGGAILALMVSRFVRHRTESRNASGYMRQYDLRSEARQTSARYGLNRGFDT